MLSKGANLVGTLTESDILKMNWAVFDFWFDPYVGAPRILSGIILTVIQGSAGEHAMKQLVCGPRRISVFFYGLFMDSELLLAKGIRPRNIRIASLVGFVLRIGQRATLLPSLDGHVYGMVMDLTHTEIDRLYSEPSVSAYRPEVVLTDLEDGTHVPALCFNLPKTSDSETVSPEYANKLRELGHRLGLPSTYIEKIGSEPFQRKLES